MIEIRMRVNTDDIIGVKESLKEYVERFGDARVISVRELSKTQMKMED